MQQSPTETIQETRHLPKKNPPTTRAERRALQEAQRKAKAERKAAGLPLKNAPVNKPNQPVGSAGLRNRTSQADVFDKVKTADHLKAQEATPPDLNASAIPQVFGSDFSSAPEIVSDVPTAFQELGANWLSQDRSGADLQCTRIIAAFKQLFFEYQPPADVSFRRELGNTVDCCVKFIAGESPLLPGIHDLVKQMKLQLLEIDGNEAHDEARSRMLKWLDDYMEQKISLATKAISDFVSAKLRGICKHPTVLTYSSSSTVEACLFAAAEQQGIDFDVIVVDSQPENQGFEMARNLINRGFSCQYILINGIMHVLSEVSLVLLRADGILANGNVIGPCGSSQVALIATKHNIPVLVLCQTYKFCEKVLTSPLEVGWPECEVVPAEFVTGVVTEIRMLPCSAVPAVLRINQPA